MMENRLAAQFDWKGLLRYTLPSVCMMVFMSTYTIVDGIFVANLVGEDALAAINLIFPLFGLAMAVALMFSTGGNAVIGKWMGEGRDAEARRFLSTLYIVGGSLGLLLSICGFAFTDSILASLGATDDLYPYAKDYLYSLAGFAVPVIFSVYTQSFFVTAGKPMLGFAVCVMGGVSNMVLDYLLISPRFFDLGIAGAGLATGIGNALPGLFGLLYFGMQRKGTLYFEKPLFALRTLGQSMYNGLSELVGSLAMAVTTMLFNFILLDLVGDSGVAAISVILYIQQMQTAMYIGYTLGVSPILAYKYGAQDRAALHRTVRQSFIIMAVMSGIIIVATLLLSEQAVGVFLARDSQTFAMAKQGLLLFLPAFLFMGVNVFLSSMFTALSNGRVSAILSMGRTLVFLVAALLVLPQFFELVGVWIAVPVAEALALLVGIYFYRKHRKKYGY